jgi:hypothetical protein
MTLPYEGGAETLPDKKKTSGLGLTASETRLAVNRKFSLKASERLPVPMLFQIASP